MPIGLGRHRNIESSGKGLPHTTGAECGLHKVVLVKGSSDDKTMFCSLQKGIMEASSSSAIKDQKSSKSSPLIHKKYLDIPYRLLKCYTPMHQSYLFYLNHKTWRDVSPQTFRSDLLVYLSREKQDQAKPSISSVFWL